MILLLSIHKNVWFAALIAVSILFGGLLILHHVPLAKRDIVATGLLGDIIITFPLSYYFLLIRPLRLKKWSILFVFTCCCAIAYLILPEHQKYYILQLRKSLVLTELVILIYAISRFRKVKTVFMQLQTLFPDFAYNLSKSMLAVLGNHWSVRLLASELIVLRFGLFYWKKTAQVSEATNRFTVYKESGYSALLSVILAVSIIEISAVHLLLLQYNKIIAMVISLLSLYGLVFIVADLSALVKSPILILKEQLLLRTGLRWRVLVNTCNIKSVEKIKDTYEPDKDCYKGGVTKSSVNILVTFKHPVCIDRIYRSPIKVNKITMSMDQADNFIVQLGIERCTS